jgi:HEPN domain-containing protein
MQNTENESNKIRYWIEIAQNDLEAAQILLAGKQYLYMGFMCQQAIEKTLKACFIMHKKTIPPFTHNLTLLAKDSSIYTDFSVEQKTLLDLLQPLNIEARYPSFREKLRNDLDEQVSSDLFLNTTELYQWLIRQYLQK